MLDKMTNQLDFQGHALLLRAERQRLLASNIANVDTPGYVARDMKFAEALTAATGGSSTMPVSQESRAGSYGTTDAGHIPLSGFSEHSTVGYAVQTQPSLDNNSVDMDHQRATFMDNAVRYEATLRFINAQAKTMLSAIQGQ
ncbi:flagellar basal body rod protein FlgB [Simplicispira hankyongi]|jgi:flagellar basal-body rod protein FlgB|uniref:Flagellar basal body rod protein FlgB n=1 Tax=Simplicispira hankyongi TaxID=2315688 RepID=A0A398C7T4_9BURK|nr:flagellar basal body rod protein FlgB [Simplicispira hankyongi]RID97297.1 flagellar basal body rod protein FlgB [Simplicispira hankyongi]